MNYYRIAEELRINPNDTINDYRLKVSNLKIGSCYAMKVYTGLNFQAHVITISEMGDENITVQVFDSGEFSPVVISVINDELYNDDGKRISIRNFKSDDSPIISNNDAEILFWENEKVKHTSKTTSNKIQIPVKTHEQRKGLEKIFSGIPYSVYDKYIEVSFNYSITFKEMVKKLNEIGIKYSYDFEI